MGEERREEVEEGTRGSGQGWDVGLGPMEQGDERGGLGS